MTRHLHLVVSATEQRGAHWGINWAMIIVLVVCVAFWLVLIAMGVIVWELLK